MRNMAHNEFIKAMSCVLAYHVQNQEKKQGRNFGNGTLTRGSGDNRTEDGSG